MRKLILVCGLLCTLAAPCAEETSPRPSGAVIPLADALAALEKSRDSTVVLKPDAVVVRLEADSIVIDQATGSIRLVGSVRVTLRDGGELQAESMTMTAGRNGQQEFRGDRMRMVRATSR
jgi:lipopolysaccharide export system protein LptA